MHGYARNPLLSFYIQVEIIKAMLIYVFTNYHKNTDTKATELSNEWCDNNSMIKHK